MGGAWWPPLLTTLPFLMALLWEFAQHATQPGPWALAVWRTSGDLCPRRNPTLDLVLALNALRACMSEPGPVVIGLGLHARWRTRVAPFGGLPSVQHDPDDVAPTATVDGIAGSVSRWVAEALAVAVGVVEFTSTPASAAATRSQGCGGRETIRALHARQRVLAPGVWMGCIDELFER